MKKAYKVYPSLEMRKRASPTFETGEPDFWNGRAWFGKRVSLISTWIFHMFFYTRITRMERMEHVNREKFLW